MELPKVWREISSVDMEGEAPAGDASVRTGNEVRVG